MPMCSRQSRRRREAAKGATFHFQLEIISELRTLWPSIREGWTAASSITTATSLSRSPSCERSLRLADPQTTKRSIISEVYFTGTVDDHKLYLATT